MRDLEYPSLAIAVVAVSGRFPGGIDTEGLWAASLAGHALLQRINRSDALTDGLDEREIDSPGYVPVKGWFDGVDRFDPAAFGYGPAEATTLDPQQRLFLEECATALDRAAIDSARFNGRIGVYAGQFISTYLLRHVLSTVGVDTLARAAFFQGNTVDQLATRVAHRLDLHGPAITVQTACSTSLVAVHAACSALAAGECDAALAGGVALTFPTRAGYHAAAGSIHSPSGYCRPFDARADGTVFSDGVGVVVLRRLSDALADGNPIRAVVLGTAVNNDGARKVGFAAPSFDGQVAVLADALAVAETAAEDVGYLETHGTGTVLGDRLETAAIRAVYGGNRTRGPLALGALKANTGHLEAAAGIAGFIRTVFALEHGVVPPIASLRTPAEGCDGGVRDLLFPTDISSWPVPGRPRRAAVSAFGVGGTNAHAVLAQAPKRATRTGIDRPRLFVVSSHSRSALQAGRDAVAASLADRAIAELSGAEASLLCGRPQQLWRIAAVAREPTDASAALLTAGAASIGTIPFVLMLCPGQGSLSGAAIRAAAAAVPAFGTALESVAADFSQESGIDVVCLLKEADDTALSKPLAQHLVGTALAVAVADCLIDLGVSISATIGHSLGEFAAAERAGYVARPELGRLLAHRGGLVASMSEGRMLTVARDADGVRAALGPHAREVDVACVNAPGTCVISGVPEAIEEARRLLAGQRVATVLLPLRRAFHGRATEGIAASWRQVLEQARLRPGRGMHSSVTGSHAINEVATGQHWVDHLVGPVRFEEAVRSALRAAEAPAKVVVIEAGVGDTLASSTTHWLRAEGFDAHAISFIDPKSADPGASALAAVGRVWTHGAPIYLERLVEPGAVRINLPGRGFDRQRCFVALVGDTQPTAPSPAGTTDKDAGAASVGLSAPRYRSIDGASDGVVTSKRRRWLIVARSQEVVEPLVEHLLDCGQVITVAVPGEKLQRLGRGAYQVPVGDAGAWTDLMRDLRALVRTPNVVVSALALGGESDATDLLSGFAAFVAGLGREATGEATEIVVLTPPVMPVLGTETLCPHAAALASACRAAGQEVASFSGRSIDVELPVGASGLTAVDAEQICRAVLDEHADLASLRGSRLFVRDFTAETAGWTSPYRSGGTYLITGGAGGVGRLLAADLAARFAATVYTLNRTPVPPTSDSDVRHLAGDVADPSAVAAALDRIMEERGRLDGVIHAAGVAPAGLLVEATTASLDNALRPKLTGLQAIAASLDAKRITPDFVCAISSTASVFGSPMQSSYAAANAAMEAFAITQDREGKVRWRVVACDTIRRTGLARVDAAGPDSMLAAHRDAVAIAPETLAGVIERAIAHSAPFVVASRIPAGDIASVSKRLGAVWQKARSGGERPDLATAYAPPEGEIEAEIAQVWSRVLGTAEIGRNDRFVDLGGHSLIAAQLRGETNRTFDVELSVAEVFEADTIARMGALLERKIGEEYLGPQPRTDEPEQDP